MRNSSCAIMTLILIPALDAVNDGRRERPAVAGRLRRGLRRIERARLAGIHGKFTESRYIAPHEPRHNSFNCYPFNRHGDRVVYRPRALAPGQAQGWRTAARYRQRVQTGLGGPRYAVGGIHRLNGNERRPADYRAISPA